MVRCQYDSRVVSAAPLLKHERGRRGSAFSLIELVVVTFIISILMAIMLPALRRSIRQAAQVVCAHNLRATDQMMQIYRADTGGWLPHVADDAEPEPGEPEPAWFDVLIGYYEMDPAVLICPEDPYGMVLERVAGAKDHPGRANASSYGMSEFMLSSPGCFLANVDRHSPKWPLNTMLLGDMGPDFGGGGQSGGGSSTVFTGPKRNECRMPWSDGSDLTGVELSGPWLTRRHVSAINVLTLGGAVRSVRTAEVMQQKVEASYGTCAAGYCTLCLEEIEHYSFAHNRTYWWTGPKPTK